MLLLGQHAPRVPERTFTGSVQKSAPLLLKTMGVQDNSSRDPDLVVGNVSY